MLPAVVLIIISILSLMFWYKKIDCKTTWVYAIYVVLINIICLSVMIKI